MGARSAGIRLAPCQSAVALGSPCPAAYITLLIAGARMLGTRARLPSGTHQEGLIVVEEEPA